jgi:hypothetical protein
MIVFVSFLLVYCVLLTTTIAGRFQALITGTPLSLCCGLMEETPPSVPQLLYAYVAVGDWCLTLPSNGSLCNISLITSCDIQVSCHIAPSFKAAHPKKPTGISPLPPLQGSLPAICCLVNGIGPEPSPSAMDIFQPSLPAESAPYCHHLTAASIGQYILPDTAL